MRIYINEYGAKVRMLGGKLIVEKGDRELNSVPIELVDGLIVNSTVQITSAVLVELSEKRVGVSWINSTNRIVCSLLVEDDGQMLRRKAQYELIGNRRLKLALSKSIISAKIANQRCLLESLNKEYRYALTDKAINELALLEKKCVHCDLAALRGIEGSASRNYFAALALHFDDKFGFTGRNRRPPKDCVNAALSFSYTLLYNYVDTVLRSKGFDTFAGILHTPRSGHRALASDIMEIFRAQVSDRAVLEFFKRADLRRDFAYNENAVYLSAEGRRGLIKSFEDSISAYSEAGEGYKKDIGGVIMSQADRLAVAVEERKASSLHPYRADHGRNNAYSCNI